MPLTYHDCQPAWETLRRLKANASISLPNACHPRLQVQHMPATPLQVTEFPCLCMQCNEQSSKVQTRHAELDAVHECQEYETEALEKQEGAPQAVFISVKPLLPVSSCCSSSACFLSHTCCGVTKADLLSLYATNGNLT